MKYFNPIRIQNSILDKIRIVYEGIIILLDSTNKIIRKTERYNAGAICQPVNWTGDGCELIAFSPSRGDGGLWDHDFQCTVPLPDCDRPELCMEVHDMLGLGIDQLVLWDHEKLQIYRPSSVLNRTPMYIPRRSFPNMSNYQVNFSLPEWK